MRIVVRDGPPWLLNGLQADLMLLQDCGNMMKGAVIRYEGKTSVRGEGRVGRIE